MRKDKHLEFYKAVQGALRTAAGSALPPLLRRWRYTQSSDFAELGLKAGGLRFLVRYGWLDASEDRLELRESYEALLVRVSRVCGDAPGIVAAWLELFASGEYGVLAEGFCAAEPRCAHCPLKENCRFLAAGGRDARSFGQSLAQDLLGGGQNVDLHAADLLAFAMNGEKSGAADIARAEALLKACNGVRGVFQSTPEALRKLDISPDAVARVRAVAELCRCWAEERSAQGKLFTCAKDFFDHFYLRLRDLKQEFFLVVLLNQKHRLIGEVQVSAGSLTEALVHPREVFAEAIAGRAAAVALVHNHPTGDPAPSNADKAITRRLVEVSKLVGIRLLDHIIVGDGKYASFAESDLLE